MGKKTKMLPNTKMWFVRTQQNVYREKKPIRYEKSRFFSAYLQAYQNENAILFFPHKHLNWCLFYSMLFVILAVIFSRGLLILLCMYSWNGCGSVTKRYKTFPPIYRMIACIQNKLLAITNSNRLQWRSI